MTTHDLITAAQAAHTDYLADQARERAEEEATREIDRQSTIEIATAHALEVLGATAETLNWRHHPEGETTDHLSAAIASLPPGRIHDGRLVYLHDVFNNTQTLALVRTCRACNDELVNDVDSLAELGALLTADQSEAEGADDQEPGPLSAADAAERRAASVAALTRQILAQHPDTSLTVDTVAVFGHEDGKSSAKLRINADSLRTLRQVADAMGLSVKTRVSGTHPGLVLEHGTAAYTSDGTEVELLAYDRLSDDEAAAWLAQQNQRATEASDAGDV